MPASRPNRQGRPKPSEPDTRKHAMRAGTKHGKISNENARESEKETWTEANKHLLNQVSGVSDESPIGERWAEGYSCPPYMSADSEAFLSPEEITAMPRPTFYRQVWSRPNSLVRPMEPLTPDDSPENEECPRRPKGISAKDDKKDPEQLRRSSRQSTTGNTSLSSDLVSSAIPNSQGHIKKYSRHQRRSVPYSRPSRTPRPSRIHSLNAWLSRMQACLSEVDIKAIDQRTDRVGLRDYNLSHVIVSHRTHPVEETNFIMLVWKDVAGPTAVDWPTLQVTLKDRMSNAYTTQNTRGSRRAVYGALVVGQLAQFYVFVGEGPAQLSLSLFEEGRETLNIEHDGDLVDGHLSSIDNEFSDEVFDDIANDPSLPIAAARCIDDVFLPETLSSGAFDLLRQPEIVSERLFSDASDAGSGGSFEAFLREVTRQYEESEHNDEADQDEPGEPQEDKQVDEHKVREETGRNHGAVCQDVTNAIDDGWLVRKALKYIGEGVLDKAIKAVCLPGEQTDTDTDDEEGKFIMSSAC
ncbi:hypothetical protein BDQ94DRAFT_169035 [Aspergillus welwitschiae]|uniref:Uncharacterized protein n=1 Tax=Aspergillus welwitschiae TaxID=1341132 RepID=A0A3F3Q7H6_9EURO|nr:hypothetical protein BDQ94DRAFT_169035 [Aspergillus welwitschiae]RDH34716.1 hypothetical protein BDQ94DRAFT_169035 [Aspergillus welwitschiae]